MKKLALAVVASALLPVSASAATIFGVDANNNLVSFSSFKPGEFTSLTPITGTAETFVAIDFRASNGLLYGLGNGNGLYTINTGTGLANLIGNVPLTGSSFGFDFNEVVDMIRVVGDMDDNFVVNPDAATASQFTDVAFGAGDANFGQDATVSGNAYLHGTTSQFAIETNADVLVTQANNAGTLGTVGALGVGVGQGASFDIGLNGVGYLQDMDRFYTVNLGTGAASLVGNTSSALSAIATPAIPEPSTWAMMLLGFGAIGFVVRRKSGVRTTVSYA